MKYCTNCGKELLDNVIICPGCGRATINYSKSDSVQTYSTISILGLIFAFFVPLVGLILSIVANRKAMKSNDMKSNSFAKAGIIISTFELILFSILILIIMYYLWLGALAFAEFFKLLVEILMVAGLS